MGKAWRIVGWTCVAVSCVVIFVTFMSVSFQVLNNDQMGVRYDVYTKSLDDDVYQQGRYALGPTKKFFVFSNTFINVDLTDVDCLSYDGLSISIDVNFQYKLQVNNVVSMYQLLGEDYGSIVNSLAESAIRDACGGYTAESFYYSRDIVQIDMLNLLSAKLNATYIDAGYLQLANVNLDPQFQSAIESTIKAQQDVQQAYNERAQQLTIAQTQVLQAQQNSTSFLATTQAQADATLSIAQGQADTITQQYLAQEQAYSSTMQDLNLTPEGLINYIALNTLQESGNLVVGVNAPAKFGF